MLQSLLEQTAEQAVRYRILCLRDPEMRRKAVREHTDILHALETEDESPKAGGVLFSSLGEYVNRFLGRFR